MSLPLAFIFLTGETRARSSCSGKLVLQVRKTDCTWRDAKFYDLKAIGYEATSLKDRQTKAPIFAVRKGVFG